LNPTNKTPSQRSEIAKFLAITFSITWGMGVLLVIFGDGMAARFGEFDMAGNVFWKAFYHVAVYAPGVAALTLIGGQNGLRGLRAFGARILKWKVPGRWYAIAAVGVLLPAVGGRVVYVWLSPDATFYPYLHETTSAGSLVLWAVLNFVDDPGPVEELGWRGYALPMLQRRFNALTATLILGVVWSIWHLPAFYLGSMNQSTMNFVAYMIFMTSFSVLMTVVYNGTRGSVLLPMLMHWLLNLHNLREGMMTYAAVAMVAVAAVLVLRLGAENLGSEKVTDPFDVPDRSITCD
jgi:CAAX protease family protein